MREAVRTQQAVRRGGEKSASGSSPSTLPAQVVRSGTAERQGAVLRERTRTQPTVDARRRAGQHAVVPSPSISSCVSRRCSSSRYTRPRLPGAEHDDLSLADPVLSRLVLAGGTRRLTTPGRPSRPARPTAGNMPDIPAGQRPFDELVEPVAVPLLDDAPCVWPWSERTNGTRTLVGRSGAHRRAAKLLVELARASSASERSAGAGGRPRRSSRTSRRWRAGRASCP